MSLTGFDRIDLAHEPELRVGELTIVPGDRLVRHRDGREQGMEPRVMQVLVTLIRAGGAILSRSDLRERCWEGRAGSDDAVDRVIARIRRLSEDIGEGSFTIETIPRVGYRLLSAPVPLDKPQAPEPDVAADDPPERPKSSTRRVVLVSGLAATALGGAAVLGARFWAPSGPSADRLLTIAVMPFENVTPDTSGGDIARGVSREIRSALSRMGGLQVIADTSSFALAEQKLDVREIGRRLGADLLLQGNVSRAGSTIRIGADLIDAGRNVILWTATHQDSSGNLFRVQDAATAAVLQELAGRIGPDHVAARPPARRRDPVAFRKVIEAQQLVEQSRALWMTGKEVQAFEAGDRAFALATDALAIDAKDVGGLLVLSALTRNGWTRDMAAQPLTSWQRASRAVGYVRAALVADPNDPAALAALGDHYRRYEWRWEEAENLLRRALAADPSLAEAHWSYAYMLGTQGRALEGLGHAKSLYRLDPETAWRRVALPRLLYMAGDRAGALGHYDRELALAPDNSFLIRELYFMYLAELDPAALEGLVAKLGDLWRGRAMPKGVEALSTRAVAGAAALRGHPAALVAIVDQDVAALDAPRTGSAATQQGRASVDLLFVYAMEYAWAGRVPRALDMLERALAARSLYWPPSLPYGRTPFPKPVRDHPRYAALWRGEPRLQQLVQTRLRAVRSGQMAGTLPNGQRVTPAKA